jgi:hypothetical protein
MKLKAALICLTVASATPAAFAQYSTGFEPPAFTSGQISGQDQWTVSAAPGTARVLTSTELATELTNAGLTPGQTVHSGSQALLVSGTGASNSTLRSMPGLEAQPLIRLDVWARPIASATYGNIFLTLEDAANTRAAAFRFGTPNGGAQTIDYGTNIANVWVATQILWDGEQWYHFTFDLDYTAKTYRLAVNGAPVTTDPIPFYNTSSANFSQVRIFRGSNQGGMIVDDLSVVAIPEPVGSSLLLLGAAVCWQRRRRRPARLL